MRKVAVDINPLSGGDSIRGIGVYTRELLKALNMTGVDISKEDLSKYDIVHLTSFNPFRVSVPFSKPLNVKFILTIYDLIPLIYPKNYPPGVKGKIKFLINKYLINKNVDAIITISETSKKDICRYLGVDPKKVFVTYLASRSMFKNMKIDEKWRSSWLLENGRGQIVPKKYVLYVGDLNYNKNIPNLVKACCLAKLPLVIAGKQAFSLDKMDLNHPELKHLQGVDWSRVIRLGFVPDEILVELYNLALVYVQPSFYEGFSLPPLQAYCCKTPLAISKNQCHVEIFGDDFDYFDPYNINEMMTAISRPNIDRKLPRTYDWKETAKKTSLIYGKI